MKNRQIIQSLFFLIFGSSISACDAKEEAKEGTIESVDVKKPVAETITQAKILQKKRDLTGLDVLTDYDRDLWSGPDGWSDEQWRWKKQLGWDRHCDYVGDVETVELNAQLQLVTVQCIPGSYQPMYYLFLFDKTKQESKRLNLGLIESSENLQEVFGSIEYSQVQKQLSILTLSRGLGDCGVFRTFQLSAEKSFEDIHFELKEMRRRQCEDHSGKDFEKLPKAIFNYQQWPLVE